MEKKDRYISIGEMAKINRTTVPTLRLYDSMGLLTPYYTDEETHYRYYDIKQNARFDMIQYMKELGMELKEIKEFAEKRHDYTGIHTGQDDLLDVCGYQFLRL